MYENGQTLERTGPKTGQTGSAVSYTHLRSDSTTSFDLHQEITENNAFAIDKVFESLVTLSLIHI